MSASEDKTLRRWTPDGQPLVTFTGHTGRVFSLIKLRDGSIVSASEDNTLRHWSIDGQCLAQLEGHQAGITQVIQQKSGILMSASEDGTLRHWDLAAGLCIAYWQSLDEGFRLVVDQKGVHLHSQKPIRMERWKGHWVPNDPAIARYAHFLVDGQAMDAWRFPQAIEWESDPDAGKDQHRLSLLWPEGYDPTEVLGRVVAI
jgi:WD40 repeat protein